MKGLLKKSSYLNFTKMLKYEISSYKNFFILYSSITLILSILFSANEAMSLKNAYRTDVTNMIKPSQTEQIAFGSSFSELLYIPAFLCFVFIIILGIGLFSCYHSKRKADTFSSLPVTKQTAFISKYLIGLAMAIIPVILSIAICSTILITAVSPLVNDLSPYFNIILIGSTKIIVGALAFYTMLSFLSLVCGTITSTLISFASLNIIYPILMEALQDDISNIIPGIKTSYKHIFPDIFRLGLSPFFSLFVDGKANEIFGYEFSATIDSLDIYWIIFSILIFIASIFVAKHHKSENIQEPFIFNKVKYIISVSIITAIGIIGGDIARLSMTVSIYQGTPQRPTNIIFILFGIFTIAVAFVVLMVILNKGFNKFKKSLPILGMSVVIFLIGFLVVSTGLFGTDQYVPNVDDIESVSFSVYSSDDDSKFNEPLERYSDIYQYEYGKSRAWFLKTSNNTQYVVPMNLRISDKTVIEKTVNMHKAITENLHNKLGLFYEYDTFIDSSIGSYDIPDFNDDDIYIEYKLKNGNIIKRFYYDLQFDISQIKPLLNEIYSSKAYKDQYIPFMQDAEISEITIDNSLDTVTYKTDEIGESDEYKKLITTLKEEIYADNNFYTDTHQASPYTDRVGMDKATITIEYKNEYRVYAKNSDVYVTHFTSNIYNNTLVIPEDTYKNTWEIFMNHIN